MAVASLVLIESFVRGVELGLNDLLVSSRFILIMTLLGSSMSFFDLASKAFSLLLECLYVFHG